MRGPELKTHIHDSMQYTGSFDNKTVSLYTVTTTLTHQPEVTVSGFRNLSKRPLSICRAESSKFRSPSANQHLLERPQHLAEQSHRSLQLPLEGIHLYRAVIHPQRQPTHHSSPQYLSPKNISIRTQIIIPSSSSSPTKK